MTNIKELKDKISTEADKIVDWNKEDIKVLYASLLSLQKALKKAETEKIPLLLESYDINDYTSYVEIPSEQFPDVRDPKNRIWFMDKKNNVLYGVGPVDKLRIGKLSDMGEYV